MRRDGSSSHIRAARNPPTISQRTTVTLARDATRWGDAIVAQQDAFARPTTNLEGVRTPARIGLLGQHRPIVYPAGMQARAPLQQQGVVAHHPIDSFVIQSRCTLLAARPVQHGGGPPVTVRRTLRHQRLEVADQFLVRCRHGGLEGHFLFGAGICWRWRWTRSGLTCTSMDGRQPNQKLRTRRSAPAGVRMVSLEELLKASDFVTVHSPLTQETRGLIGRAQLQLMKPTAFLINAARGPLVDEAALVEALQARKIGGAGLDVLATEPPSPASPLLTMPNVIITPHTAFYSQESLLELELRTAGEVVRVLNGERPQNWINPEIAGKTRAKLR